MQLIKENKDCTVCLGDHKDGDCTKPDRVCGGGKQDRGCTKNHQVHELLYVDAKVFALSVTSMSINRGSSGGVMLLIMQTRTLCKGQLASVFIDNGSDSNFVREEYALEHNYK